MRKILASLFAISALVAVGVFATGAYFSKSVVSPDITFTAGSPDFNIALVQGDQNIGPVGPGWTKHVCVEIQNAGPFALNMTQKINATAGSPDLYAAVLLRVLAADNSCTPTGTFNDWSALNNYDNYVVPMGSVTSPGGTAFVVEDLKWNETGTDQSALEGLSFTLHVTINGQTLP